MQGEKHKNQHVQVTNNSNATNHSADIIPIHRGAAVRLSVIYPTPRRLCLPLACLSGAGKAGAESADGT